MNHLRLRANEMMFFLDFNNTLVDYTNEYDVPRRYFDEIENYNPYHTRTMLAKSLCDFEKKTGITPVICVVTNARGSVIDNNGFNGICNDLYKTFFYDEFNTNIQANYDVRRFFKYLMHYENDTFIKLHPNAETYLDVFEIIPFSEETRNIRYISQFKKKESVDRLMSVVDPRKNTSKYILFAGDSIKDDYPMKEIWTPEGVAKIFIRPYKSRKLNYSIMREFCEAKGDMFSSINPKNGKKIICTDPISFSLMKKEDQAKILNYDSGDYVFLTPKNTRGLLEGFEKSALLISDLESKQKQML